MLRNLIGNNGKIILVLYVYIHWGKNRYISRDHCQPNYLEFSQNNGLSCSYLQ